MTAVPPNLHGHDVGWSSCAFGHPGSIERGLRFLHAAVDRLRPGGVAVHTTGSDPVSDGHMVDQAPTVLVRHRDMERLASPPTRAGHRVPPLHIDPGDDWRDGHIDVPPYQDSPHLKLTPRR